MARIIKIGPSPQVEKEVDCRGCGATIGYTENDIQRRDGTDIGGGPDGEKFVMCPNCSKRIILESW